MNKKITISAVSLFVGYILCGILQLWFGIFSNEIFVKLSITTALLLLISVAVILVRYHLAEESSLKDDKYVN